MRAAFSNAIITGVFAIVFASPDFSGTWVCNPIKSGAKSASGNTEITLVIRHTSRQLNILRRIEVAGKQIESNYQFELDGGEHTVSSSGFGTYKYTARWIGNELIIDGTRSMASKSVPHSFTYSLSADGKSLNVSESLGQGVQPTKQVYVRK